MAVATRISIAAAKVAVDAVVDRAENGTGANCTVKIISGTQADDPDDGTFTGTTLCTIDLGTTTPAFSAAATGTGADAGYATANANTILTKTGTAGATGTAAWFRAFDQGGNAFIDGSVGTSDADMIIDNTSITSGQQVKLLTWKVRLSKT